MAETISDGTTSNFSPDLFSPLQFCEVVDDGLQQLVSISTTQVSQQVSQASQHLSQTSHSETQTSNSALLQTQVSCHHSQSSITQSASQERKAHPHISQCQPQLPQQQTQLAQCQISDHQPQLSQHQSQLAHNQPQLSQHQSHHPQLSQNSAHPHQKTPNQLCKSPGSCLGSQQNVSSQKPLKEETSQPSHQKLIDTEHVCKPSSLSSVEYILSSSVSRGVHLQHVDPSIVTIHQQPVYQVQLNRHEQHVHQLVLNTLQVQGQPQTITLSPQQISTQVSVPSVIGVQALLSDKLPVPQSSLPIVCNPATAAVATQTTPTENSVIANDEPEIIFSSSINSSTASKTSGSNALSNKMDNGLFKKPFVISGIMNNQEIKPIPIKRTWRRPWKKKKEREKKQPVRKARRVKRRRMVVPKRTSVHIDPRNGPPVDTTTKLVERKSEENINQLKQKRQRIKLNRNSGREYINRLGKIVTARKIGQPCNCPLKCWERMGAKVVEIFNNFWDLCDFNLQNSYLFTCLKLCDVKRRYTKRQPAEESRRQNTFEYFVRICGKHLRVCKKAFMSSHGLTSDKRLRTLFTQMKDGALIPEPDRRGKHFRPAKSSINGGIVQASSRETNQSHHSIVQTKCKVKSKSIKKKSQSARTEMHKQQVYSQHHPVGHIPHCTPPVPTTHAAAMQEPPHSYIPNGDIYFPGHYLEPPQSMAHAHMNQMPCQKMLEAPAYFMAGMKENTFHQ